MTRFIPIILAAFLIATPLSFADTDAQVAARSDAIDLAGAFQNDGFKIRDGDYFGQLTKGQSQIVTVNLYSGNAYWFTASTRARWPTWRRPARSSSPTPAITRTARRPASPGCATRRATWSA